MEGECIDALYTAMVQAIRNGDDGHARSCASDILDVANEGGPWQCTKRKGLVVAECKIVLGGKQPAFMDCGVDL